MISAARSFPAKQAGSTLDSVIVAKLVVSTWSARASILNVFGTHYTLCDSSPTANDATPQKVGKHVTNHESPINIRSLVSFVIINEGLRSKRALKHLEVKRRLLHET